jgi:hypothetical protein
MKLQIHGDSYALIQDDKMIAFASDHFTNDHLIGKLSKQNCNSLFGVVNVEKLAMDWRESTGYHDADSYSYILGFKKAMELNKDKVFTLEQMSVAYNTNRSGTLFEQLINSFGGQPTEIEVEIEMDICGDKVYAVPEPKIDSEGCLILKRVV